jgi:hypothetical protein
MMATPDRLPSTMPTMVLVDRLEVCSLDDGIGGKGALDMGPSAVSIEVDDVPMESCVGESANTDEAGYAVFIDTEEIERESGSRGFAMNDRLCNDDVLVSKPEVSFATLSLNVNCQTINYINLHATAARRSAFLLFHMNVSLSFRSGSGYVKEPDTPTIIWAWLLVS